MENIIRSLLDTKLPLATFEENLSSSISMLREDENVLRSYLILRILTEQSSVLKEFDVTDFEKRLVAETDELCKTNEIILKGVKVHADWLQELIEAVSQFEGCSGIKDRFANVNKQIEKLEDDLKSVIEKRNNCPIKDIMVYPSDK